MQENPFSESEKIELRKYSYNHGVPNSTVGDEPLIGRTHQMEQLLGWLKLNHREPGTGKRHGCYLVTGVRGVGKTAFVNRVLFHYRKWLLWLYGDELKQFDEIHLNLGAGPLSAFDVLKVLAESIYRKTRANYLEPILRSHLLWYLSLFLVAFISYGIILAWNGIEDRSSHQHSATNSVIATQEAATETNIASGKIYFTLIKDATKYYITNNILSPSFGLTGTFNWPKCIASNSTSHNGLGTQIEGEFARLIIRTNENRAGTFGTNIDPNRNPNYEIPLSWTEVLAPIPVMLFLIGTIIPMIRIFQRPIIRRSEGRFAEQLARLISFSLIIIFIANLGNLLNKTELFAGLALALYLLFAFSLSIKWWKQHRELDPERTPGHAANDFTGLLALGILTYCVFPDVTETIHGFQVSALNVTITFCGILALYGIVIVFRQLHMLRQAPYRETIPNEYYTNKFYSLKVGLHLIVLTLGLCAWSGLFGSKQASVISNGTAWFLVATIALAYFYGTAKLPRLAWHNIELFDAKKKNSLNFRYILGYIKAMVIIGAIGAFVAILLGKAEPNSIFSGTLRLVSITLLDGVSWLEILFPLVFIVAVSDAIFAGHALREPDFGRPNIKLRQDDNKIGRDDLILKGGTSSSLLFGSVERFMRHVFYQRRIRAVYRRLRNPTERQLGVASIIPQTPSISFRWQQLPYTFQTLESDLVELCEMYNRAYPSRDLIIVCDELDKITLDKEKNQRTPENKSVPPPTLRPQQINAVRELLSDLKNILSSAEARFIFIAGREIHDHWLMDTAEKVNVVSGAFATPIDIPSLLTDQADSVDTSVESLTTSLILTKVLDEQEQELSWRDFHDHLMALKSRAEITTLFPDLTIKRRRSSPASEEDLIRLIRLHYYHYPSIYAGAVALLKRRPLDKSVTVNKRAILRAVRETWILRDLIYYLTLRAEGLPSAIYLHFDRFVEQGDDKRQLQLTFDRRSLPFLQLASFIVTVLRLDMSRAASQHNDKVVMSAMHFASYLCRFGPTAFEWSMAERLRDVVSPYHDPNTRDVLKRIFARVDNTYLDPINNGVYSHRFREWLRGEMAYASTLNVHEAAAYSFGLEQGEEIRNYVLQQINYLKDAHEKKSDGVDTTLALHSQYFTLGSLYEIEEMYDQALVYYELALRELKNLSNTQQTPDNETSFNSLSLYWSILHIRTRLRIGHVNEKTGNLVQAAGYYHVALTFSLWIIDKIKLACSKNDRTNILQALRDSLPRLVTNPVIWQPFMCIACVTMKQEQASSSPDRLRAINDLCDHLNELLELLKPDEWTGKIADNDMVSLRNVVEELRVTKADALSRLGDIFLVAGERVRKSAISNYAKSLTELRSSHQSPIINGRLEETTPCTMRCRAIAANHSNIGDAILSVLADNKDKLPDKWLEWINYIVDTVVPDIDRVDTPYNINIHKTLSRWYESSRLSIKTHHWRRATFQLVKIISATQRVMLATKGVFPSDNEAIIFNRLKVMLTNAQAWSRNYMGDAGEIARRNDEVLINIIKEVINKRYGGMAGIADEELNEFCFAAPEAREAELRLLSCATTHQWNIVFRGVGGNKLNARLWRHCIRDIRRLETYYSYCAFPVRLRALCLELAGDWRALMAKRRLERMISAKQKIARLSYVVKRSLQAYEYYRLALDIRQGFGASFSATNFSVAHLREKSGEILELVETAVAESESQGSRIDKLFNLNTALTFLSRSHETPLTESQCHEVSSVVQYRYALDAYRASISIRTMGREFWLQYRKRSYLTDDFHGEEIHYTLAYESMMVNYCKSRADHLRKHIEKIENPPPRENTPEALT